MHSFLTSSTVFQTELYCERPSWRTKKGYYATLIGVADNTVRAGDEVLLWDKELTQPSAITGALLRTQQTSEPINSFFGKSAKFIGACTVIPVFGTLNKKKDTFMPLNLSSDHVPSSTQDTRLPHHLAYYDSLHLALV